MINKLKLGLFSALIFALFAFAGSANAANVNYSTDTTVNLGGTDYTILSGSGAASVAVGTTTLTVTPDSVASFTLASADKFNLNNDLNTSLNECTTRSTLVLAAGSGAMVITPDNTTTCDGSVVGGGSGGSGHGHTSGGGSSNTTVAANNPAEGCFAGNLFSTTTGQACGTAVVGCGSGNAFSPITGQSCGNVNVNTTIVTTTNSGPFSYAFGTTTIKLGSSGAACSAWQNFFNDRTNAQLVVDGKCGPKTMAAARAWQASAGLVADGLLGPMSRAKAVMQGSMSTPGQ